MAITIDLPQDIVEKENAIVLPALMLLGDLPRHRQEQTGWRQTAPTYAACIVVAVMGGFPRNPHRWLPYLSHKAESIKHVAGEVKDALCGELGKIALIVCVEVGPGEFARPSHHNFVVAVDAAAAMIPGRE